MDLLPSNTYENQQSTKRTQVLRRILFGELTEKQRICIVLYFQNGLTLDAIGKELGIGKSTVSRHIKTGKTKIKKCLEYSGEKGSLHLFS